MLVEREITITKLLANLSQPFHNVFYDAFRNAAARCELRAEAPPCLNVGRLSRRLVETPCLTASLIVYIVPYTIYCTICYILNVTYIYIYIYIYRYCSYLLSTMRLTFAVLQHEILSIMICDPTIEVSSS